MPKSAKPGAALKVKDLTPKSDAAKDVKGGAVGPCGRSAK